MKAKKTRTSKDDKPDASFSDDDKPSSRPAPARRRQWRRAFYWTVVLGIWGLILGGAGMVWIAWDLPDVDQAIAATRAPVIRVVTLQGTEIARRGERYGEPVKLQDVPPALPHAILATEDRRFYDHFGLDVIGIARAMVTNIKAGGIVQGGSTLTQQAAKNLFLAPERTYRRKLQEVVLALWLEAKFTKDEIFTIYLNRVYFGQGAYGVDAAAKLYFGKSVYALDTYQAAVLAGMLKGPNRYNPITNPKLAMQRADVVLDNMVKAGYLSEKDAKAIVRPKALPKGFQARIKPMAHHFTDWVLEQVGDYVTLDQDVTVIVTIDERMQAAAEAAMARMMKEGGQAEQRGASEAALVALAPDGAVVAMVGGADYGKSKFNRAVQALRQPGSAFKPIVYLAGMEAGLSPATHMTDEPLTIDNWSPKNFKDEYLGDMTLADALARSINTIAVKVSEHAGHAKVWATAGRLGITSDMTDQPSLALGVSETSVLDMTAAYAALATGGIGVWPYAIAEVQDARGKPLYVRSGGGPGRVLPAQHAGAMNGMLKRVIESDIGTGQAARLDRPAAGKTGTSQDFRDAWFIGYTPDLIAGVWMGNDDGAAMQGVTGGSLPALLWKDFMTVALKDTPVRDLPTGTVPQAQPESAPAAPQGEDPVTTIIKGIIDTLFGN